MPSSKVTSLKDNVKQFQADLGKLDSQAQVYLFGSYSRTYATLMSEIEQLANRIQDLKNSGVVPSESLVQKLMRDVALVERVQLQVSAFTKSAHSKLVSDLYEGAKFGVTHARELVVSVMGNWPTNLSQEEFVTFNPNVLTRVLAQSRYYSSANAYDNISLATSDSVERTFIEAVVKGLGPREIVDALATSLSIPVWRAATVSRTELMRAYRDTAIETYNENSDIVTGYVRRSARGSNTCPMCIAMDGEFQSLNTPFATHPNCRCIAIPVTKSWEELGYDIPDDREPIELGSDWFGSQNPDFQIELLGKSRYDLWRSGVSLKDMVGTYDHPIYGPSMYTRPLKDFK